MKREDNVLVKVVCLATMSFFTLYTIAAKTPQAENVFYMMGDGMGINEAYAVTCVTNSDINNL